VVTTQLRFTVPMTPAVKVMEAVPEPELIVPLTMLQA